MPCHQGLSVGSLLLRRLGATCSFPRAGKDPVSGMGLAEGWSEERTGTYCYGVVVLDVEVVIVVEIESVIVTIVLVGHAHSWLHS